jgi:hypothetical protein
LSLGTDLGLGQPMEHMVRACLIALGLAKQLGLDESKRTVVYYSGLLAWVGCHTDAYEQAKWLGDDLAVKRDAHYGYDFGRAVPATAFMLKHIGGAGRPLLERARVTAGFLGDGRRSHEALAENHYLATDELAQKLGLGEDVREALRQSYERWDGKGAYGQRRRRRHRLAADQSRRCRRGISPDRRSQRRRGRRAGTERHPVRPGTGRGLLRPSTNALQRP